MQDGKADFGENSAFSPKRIKAAQDQGWLTLVNGVGGWGMQDSALFPRAMIAAKKKPMKAPMNRPITREIMSFFLGTPHSL